MRWPSQFAKRRARAARFWLPGEIRVTGQAAFGRNNVNSKEKLLQSLEIRFAFDPGQILPPSSARVMPAFGDNRGAGRHIVGPNEHETGRSDQSLVLTRRQKKIGADRTPRRNLLVRHQPADHHRVREQHMPSRLQDAEPFPEYIPSPRDVAHGIVGEDGIERIPGKGQ